MVCLGFKPRGRKMVGTDKTTELWRPPDLVVLQFGFCAKSKRRVQSKKFALIFLTSNCNYGLTANQKHFLIFSD